MRALVLCAALCAPLWATAQDAQTDCTQSANAVLSILPNIDADAPVLRAGVCTIATARIDDATLSDIAFGWTEAVGVRDVAVTIDSIDFGARRFEVMATFQYAPRTGALNLQGLVISGDDGSAVRATGEMILQGVEMSVLQRLNAQVVVTPDLLGALQLDAGNAPRARVTDVLNGLDARQLDRQSRQDILRFTGVMPDARGRLDISLEANGGVAFAQMGLPFVRANPDDLPTTLSAALRGIQAQVRWNPGRM